MTLDGPPVPAGILRYLICSWSRRRTGLCCSTLPDNNYLLATYKIETSRRPAAPLSSLWTRIFRHPIVLRRAWLRTYNVIYIHRYMFLCVCEHYYRRRAIIADIILLQRQCSPMHSRLYSLLLSRVHSLINDNV